MRIRRTEFLFFYHTTGQFLDLKLRDIRQLDAEHLMAIPILLGEERRITTQDFLELIQIPTGEWMDSAETPISKDRINGFLDVGMLLSDEAEDEKVRAFYWRDRILKSQRWNIYAALFHFMTKFKDLDRQFPILLPARAPEVNLSALIRAAADVEKAADPFHTANSGKKDIPLPEAAPQGALYDRLTRRRTARRFDPVKPLSFLSLSILLKYVFGSFGLVETKTGEKLLQKTSPSASALHPTEVYLLVLNTAGLSPGLYHYRVETHGRALLEEYSPADARRQATVFTAGQENLADAAVLFILTHRFYRSFTKYKKHPRAYHYLIREAAYLSQNFFLVCTELGLGSFTSVANAVNIEESLQLDGFAEGVALLLGCGHTLEGPEDRKSK